MEKPSREELKKRLRDKINGKKTDSVNTKNIKKDPQTTLLNMGIDNPEIIKLAPGILKNPHSALSNLKGILKEQEEEAPP